jgi:hypothetical protein
MRQPAAAEVPGAAPPSRTSYRAALRQTSPAGHVAANADSGTSRSDADAMLHPDPDGASRVAVAFRAGAAANVSASGADASVAALESVAVTTERKSSAPLALVVKATST